MRLSWPLAAAVLLLVSGCLASQQAPAGDQTVPIPVPLPHLSFLAPVNLTCPAEGVSQAQDIVFRGDCGAFGEPVIEVAGDGAVWASATCCIGRSPTIWVSRDGAKSFAPLPFADRTGAVRDAFGIEGDFAMDDAGNVYFFDIAAATTYFSKYLADGTHVFTKSDAFPPLVDRPWVRGGKADEVWVFYNTGSATNLYHSTNGGLTWTLTPLGFSCALMTFGQGPSRDRLLVAGCSNAPQLSVSTDGGATFSAPIPLPVPDLGLKPADFKNGTGTDAFMPPVSDAAGTIYVPFTYAMDKDDHQQGLYVDIVHADGRVVGPILVSSRPWNEKPWGAAGAAGQFAVAWYGSDADRSDPSKAVWHLQVAATETGDSDAPVFNATDADPVPVLKGDFGRALGDFLQSDIGPDGRLYTVYAQRGEDGKLVNRVVVSGDGVSFGPGIPTNGPKS